MSTNTKQPPVLTLQDRFVKVAVWKNDSDKGAFYSATLERTYKDGDAYKSSNSFSGRDMLAAGQLMLRAYEQTLEMEQEDYVAAHSQLTNER